MARMLQAANAAEERYISRFIGKTLVALFEGDCGYTENYIRVYNESANEGGMYEVRLTKSIPHGAQAVIVKEI